MAAAALHPTRATLLVRAKRLCGELGAVLERIEQVGPDLDSVAARTMARSLGRLVGEMQEGVNDAVHQGTASVQASATNSALGAAAIGRNPAGRRSQTQRDGQPVGSRPAVETTRGEV